MGVIPPTILLQRFTLPMRVTSAQPARSSVAPAPKSNYDAITLEYAGHLAADTPTALRTALAALWTALRDPAGVTVEVWPGRTATAFLEDSADTRRWPGPSDTLTEVRFTLTVPDPTFRSTNAQITATYHSP